MPEIRACYFDTSLDGFRIICSDGGGYDLLRSRLPDVGEARVVAWGVRRGLQRVDVVLSDGRRTVFGLSSIREVMEPRAEGRRESREARERSVAEADPVPVTPAPVAVPEVAPAVAPVVAPVAAPVPVAPEPVIAPEIALPVMEPGFVPRVWPKKPGPMSMVRVKALRLQQELTTTELARRAGMAPPNLHRLERGVHEPTLATLKRIAEALGVPVDTLM